MNYSPELKDALLRRMLPPNNESITKISREEGISEQTLCIPLNSNTVQGLAGLKKTDGVNW